MRKIREDDQRSIMTILKRFRLWAAAPKNLLLPIWHSRAGRQHLISWQWKKCSKWAGVKINISDHFSRFRVSFRLDQRPFSFPWLGRPIFAAAHLQMVFVALESVTLCAIVVIANILAAKFFSSPPRPQLLADISPRVTLFCGRREFHSYTFCLICSLNWCYKHGLSNVEDVRWLEEPPKSSALVV